MSVSYKSDQIKGQIRAVEKDDQSWEGNDMKAQIRLCTKAVGKLLQKQR